MVQVCLGASCPDWKLHDIYDNPKAHPELRRQAAARLERPEPDDVRTGQIDLWGNVAATL